MPVGTTDRLPGHCVLAAAREFFERGDRGEQRGSVLRGRNESRPAAIQRGVTDSY